MLRNQEALKLSQKLDVKKCTVIVNLSYLNENPRHDMIKPCLLSLLYIVLLFRCIFIFISVYSNWCYVVLILLFVILYYHNYFKEVYLQCFILELTFWMLWKRACGLENHSFSRVWDECRKTKQKRCSHRWVLRWKMKNSKIKWVTGRDTGTRP